MVEPYESRRQKKPTGAVKADFTSYKSQINRPIDLYSYRPWMAPTYRPVTPPPSMPIDLDSYWTGMGPALPPKRKPAQKDSRPMMGPEPPPKIPVTIPPPSMPIDLDSYKRRMEMGPEPPPGLALHRTPYIWRQPLTGTDERTDPGTTSQPKKSIWSPRPLSLTRPPSPWNYVQHPVARGGVAGGLEQMRPRPQVSPQPDTADRWQAYTQPVSFTRPPSPWNYVLSPATSAGAATQPAVTPPAQTPVQPQTRSYPMYPGSSEWDTAPGWLARAGGVNTSTPDGRMFAAMNQPSVPAAKPAAPTGPSPWDIGTAAMNLSSPEMVKPYESAADRHAQAAAQQRRRPVGGQMAGELAASAGNFSTGPNLSIPGGAEAVARAEAKRQQAATLAQSFDRLRERSQAVPFGTYLAGTPETIGNLTEGRPWIDPAKTTTETMTWDEYLMKNQAQKAAMEQGRPFDLVPAWIGPSGRQRPPSTWELAKNKKSTRGDGSKVADAVRSRAAERRLKEEPRQAMVTAKAQGRRISPVQAGVEAALTAGRGLTEDQLRVMYGPVFDEIKAQREDSSNKLLAGIAAAIGGAMQPGPNGEPAASPLTISSIFGPLLNRAMGQEGGAPTMPWPGAAPDDSPYGKVSRAFGLQPELFAQFNKALNAGDFDTARKMGRGVAQDQETVAAVEALIRAYEGSPPPLPKRPAQVSPEAMKRLEEKAAAGDQKAQQVLEEHKRTWPGGVQDKGYFIGEGGVSF